MEEKKKNTGCLKIILYLVLIFAGLYVIVEIMDGIDNILSGIPSWVGIMVGVVGLTIYFKYFS